MRTANPNAIGFPPDAIRGESTAPKRTLRPRSAKSPARLAGQSMTP